MSKTLTPPRISLPKFSHSQVIFSPRLSKTKKSIPLPPGIFNQKRKQELSQEQYMSRLTEELDKLDAPNLSREERFKLHQHMLDKIIDRFEVQSLVFTKIKQGYEGVMDKLRQESPKPIQTNQNLGDDNGNLQIEIKKLQDKIVNKREKYKTLITSLKHLITDITSENEGHVKEIENYKDLNSNLEIKKLNAEANLADLNSRYNKKLKKYDKALQEQRQSEDGLNKLEVEIKGQIVIINELISNCSSQTDESIVMEQEIKDLDAKIVEFTEKENQLNQKIKEREDYTVELQNEVDSFNDKFQEIRNFDDNLKTQLYVVAKSLRIHNKIISKADNVHDLLELCINKRRDINLRNESNLSGAEEAADS